MKILFIGELNDINTEKMVNKYIDPNEYTVIHSEEVTENKEYALYSSKDNFIRVDVEYMPETDLYKLRIVEVPVDLGEDNQYRILGLKKFDDLKISQRQVEMLVAALHEYIKIIQVQEYKSVQKQISANLEIEGAEKLKEYLESTIEYSYYEACETCKIKSAKKKNDMLGLGAGAFEQLVRRK